MQRDFWLDRWQTRQIGWHQAAVHPFLERQWPRLDVRSGGRVYVPLCGKSLDMVWLADRGLRVVGTELAATGIGEFFTEQGFTDIRLTQHGPFIRHAAEPVEILEGDAFALTPELLGSIDAVYDRAALFALPPDLRARHAALLAHLLPVGAPLLLITFEYPQALKAGPPFAVMPDEVERLFSNCFSLMEVERRDLIDESPKFAEAGIAALHEVGYVLRRNALSASNGLTTAAGPV